MSFPVIKVGDTVRIKALDELAKVQDIDPHYNGATLYIVVADKAPAARLAFRREHLAKPKYDFRKHGCT